MLLGTDIGQTGSDSPKECAFSRKRLHPPSQTFASAIVNVCGEKTSVVESLSPLVCPLSPITLADLSLCLKPNTA